MLLEHEFKLTLSGLPEIKGLWVTQELGLLLGEFSHDSLELGRTFPFCFHYSGFSG